MRITLIAILVGGLLADGRSDGRRGNQAFGEGNYEAASEAYQQGLATVADKPDPDLAFGLLNNLGASLYRMENEKEALEAFETAMLQARLSDDRALASYNAGNAAFRTDDLQRALAHYRKTLLEDPSDDAARFNYEFVKRRLSEQEDGGQQDPQDQGDQQQDQDQQGEGDEGQQEQEQEQEDSSDPQQNPEGDQQDQDAPQPQDDDQSPQDEEGNQDQPTDQEQDGRPDQGAPPEDTEELSREEAERILQALEADEADLLREVQRMDARPRRVEKDW